MKLAVLLFAFVLIGSINYSMQVGRGKYKATPSPKTLCYEGYESITTVCNPDPEALGDNGITAASESECKRKCGGEAYCSSKYKRCCCRK